MRMYYIVYFVVIYSCLFNLIDSFMATFLEMRPVAQNTIIFSDRNNPVTEYSEGCESKRLWSAEKCKLWGCVANGGVQLRSGNKEFERGLRAHAHK